MLFGLSHIDLDKNQDRKAIRGEIKEVTLTGFAAKVHSFDGSNCFATDISWLAMPNDGIHLEYGSCNTYEEVAGGVSVIMRRMHFTESFDSPPKVCCRLTEINKTGPECFSLKTWSKDITTTGFTLVIESWANRTFDGARIGWFAYDTKEDAMQVKSGTSLANRRKREAKFSAEFYGTPFTARPATFIAISEIDFGLGGNIRATAEIQDVTASKMDCSCGTWLDSDMDHIGITWIALE